MLIIQNKGGIIKLTNQRMLNYSETSKLKTIFPISCHKLQTIKQLIIRIYNLRNEGGKPYKIYHHTIYRSYNQFSVHTTKENCGWTRRNLWNWRLVLFDWQTNCSLVLKNSSILFLESFVLKICWTWKAYFLLAHFDFTFGINHLLPANEMIIFWN